jgi:C-terminal processing protease CtpA/Prc
MRKLGIWGGVALAVTLLAGFAGTGAGPAGAQDRAVPWLGVEMQSLSDALREGMDYKGDGVLVSRVKADSPADRAGIRKGDIIVSLNSRAMKSPDELTATIRNAKVGQKVTMVLVHDGQRRTVSAQLVERPEDSVAPDADRDDLEDLPQRIEREVGPMMHWHDDGEHTYVFRSMGRGRMGIRVEDLNADLGSYFSKPDGKGALILEVLKDTPAERAGLKAGDVITRIGDHDIAGSDDVVEALGDAPKGPISVTVLRKGAKRTFSPELEAEPRAVRVGPGHDMMVFRPHAAPDRQDEVQRLRDQVRELEERLDKLESKP